MPCAGLEYVSHSWHAAAAVVSSVMRSVKAAEGGGQMGGSSHMDLFEEGFGMQASFGASQAGFAAPQATFGAPHADFVAPHAGFFSPQVDSVFGGEHLGFVSPQGVAAFAAPLGFFAPQVVVAFSALQAGFCSPHVEAVFGAPQAGFLAPQAAAAFVAPQAGFFSPQPPHEDAGLGAPHASFGAGADAGTGTDAGTAAGADVPRTGGESPGPTISPESNREANCFGLFVLDFTATGFTASSHLFCDSSCIV